jgi:hypothetical protein
MIGDKSRSRWLSSAPRFNFPFTHLLTHSWKSPRKLHVESVETEDCPLVIGRSSIQSLYLRIELSVPYWAKCFIRRVRFGVLTFHRVSLSADRFSNFRLLCSRLAVDCESGNEQIQSFQAMFRSEYVNESTIFKRKVKISRLHAGYLSSSRPSFDMHLDPQDCNQKIIFATKLLFLF